MKRRKSRRVVAFMFRLKLGIIGQIFNQKYQRVKPLGRAQELKK